jgi:hypothetical protein
MNWMQTVPVLVQVALCTNHSALKRSLCSELARDNAADWNPYWGQSIFFLSKRADRLWYPPSLRVQQAPGFFFKGKAAGTWHVALRLRMSGAITLLPTHAFNLWTGPTVLLCFKWFKNSDLIL